MLSAWEMHEGGSTPSLVQGRCSSQGGLTPPPSPRCGSAVLVLGSARLCWIHSEDTGADSWSRRYRSRFMEQKILKPPPPDAAIKSFDKFSSRFMELATTKPGGEKHLLIPLRRLGSRLTSKSLLPMPHRGWICYVY